MPNPLRRPLLTYGSLLVAIAMTASAAADVPDVDCERKLRALSQLAAKQEVIRIETIDRTATASGDGPEAGPQLRWHAMGQEFVVDLNKPASPAEQKSVGESDSDDRQMFTGQLRGKSTELVLFWRWTSGEWEGDIKSDTDLFSIRSDCRSSGTKQSILYHIKYPAEPEA